MSYIIKNTSALISTRLTDTARQKLSEGNFNISYFQVGDSEVTYNTLDNYFTKIILLTTLKNSHLLVLTLEHSYFCS